MKHISSLASGVALGTAGMIMMSTLTGCEQRQQETQNKFLVIEQLPNGKYKVVEEMPTEGPTRAIIREHDEYGNIRERFMNEDEMKALAAQEYEKVQNGTSETVQENPSGEGMGLAGTILAVAAGSLLGNMIANSLMNNKAFSRNTRSAYTSSAYKQSKQRTSTKKSFFGKSSKSSTYKRSSFFGG
ncbi:hypothetical protein [Sulfurimonas paralvinellae]|uniref:UPF0323 domain-containing protein n=1 Tax=Sulfurimonas paralvinellae TaxID=317658 RepID=A0A7M1B8M0_9BACT|nr:hypothetical protein [Sulfurimonas paralvinellae]QOP46067.1 hypothetical protein FM071_07055 [Sulfurimonas paralvinellae]